jgi:endonuclease/exonuclease/phosphatase (EEP) superfamily protein YafD
VKRITALAACAYPLVLVAAVLLVRCFSDDWWLLEAALYLPRILLAIPMIALLPLLIALRLPRLLWTQLVASLVLLFPLMGLVLPSPYASASGPTLRLMSYNVHDCLSRAEVVDANIRRHSPDVVLLQEICSHSQPIIERLRSRYPLVRAEGQFLVASRFPLRDVLAGKRLKREDREYDVGSIRYVFDTPLGRITIYSLHPASPREALDALRGIDVRAALRAGNLLRGGLAESVARENREVRELQLTAAATLAASDPNPVVLSGDTNLPGLSPVLERQFSTYQDGFSSAGWGFGYTFPSQHPWLRLDRMFASRTLRFTSFLTGCGTESDHRCIVAELSPSAAIRGTHRAPATDR